MLIKVRSSPTAVVLNTLPPGESFMHQKTVIQWLWNLPGSERLLGALSERGQYRLLQHLEVKCASCGTVMVRKGDAKDGTLLILAQGTAIWYGGNRTGRGESAVIPGIVGEVYRHPPDWNDWNERSLVATHIAVTKYIKVTYDMLQDCFKHEVEYLEKLLLQSGSVMGNAGAIWFAEYLTRTYEVVTTN